VCDTLGSRDKDSNMNEEKWIKQYKEMMEFYDKRIKHLEESLMSAMELNRKLMSMVVEVRENRD
jgi:hypothetical protein